MLFVYLYSTDNVTYVLVYLYLEVSIYQYVK